MSALPHPGPGIGAACRGQHGIREYIVKNVILTARNGELEARTSFMVARIMHTGETTLFATGCYRDRIVLDGDVATFAEKVVVIDSRLIDTLLAIPL